MRSPADERTFPALAGTFAIVEHLEIQSRAASSNRREGDDPRNVFAVLLSHAIR